MDNIGRYTVERRLGVGGFATVWLGHDPVLDAPVAIKVLADNWAGDPDIVQRFLTEARLLRRINDPRVVRVHDHGLLANGVPYFVMDYADGGTLADLIKTGISTRVALDRAVEAAEAVQALHDYGIVHRDVKPSNLLIDKDALGRPRLVVADLGVAKPLAEAAGFTVSAGSPAFMAPEQALGQADAFDQRADVYALGAVAYALLAGRPPFNTPQGVVSVATRDPQVTPEPIAARLGLPVVLDAVLHRALAHDPHYRQPSSAVLASELRNVVALSAPLAPVTALPTSDPVSLGVSLGASPTVISASAASTPDPWPTPAQVQPRRRSRGPLIAGLTALVTIGAAVGGYAVLSRQSAAPALALNSPTQQSASVTTTGQASATAPTVTPTSTAPTATPTAAPTAAARVTTATSASTPTKAQSASVPPAFPAAAVKFCSTSVAVGSPTTTCGFALNVQQGLATANPADPTPSFASYSPPVLDASGVKGVYVR